MGLSIVIPTYNATRTLAAVLAEVGKAADELPLEVIVADGGSDDRTVELAERLGARIVRAVRGRGPQLAAGAEAAQGDWLFFLHADTIPGQGWTEAFRRFMAESSNRERAAVLRLALDDPGAKARRLEAIVAWRTRALGLPYGDQGLLISTAFYRALGGYRPIPIMEDVDLVRRIGRGRLTVLDTTALTSAERYRHGGWILRPLRNLSCLGLYLAGLPPRFITRLYATPGQP